MCKMVNILYFATAFLLGHRDCMLQLTNMLNHIKFNSLLLCANIVTYFLHPRKKGSGCCSCRVK